MIIKHQQEEVIRKIAYQIEACGGRAFYTGGCVRDYYLGIRIFHDLDIEIYQLSLEKLMTILSGFGKCKIVGKSYPLIIVKGLKNIDFTLSQLASPYQQQPQRRDFTINAMMLDILTGEHIDPYHGLVDLRKQQIKHCEPGIFLQDPLRVYRGIELASRLRFEIHPVTRNMMNKTDCSALPGERVFIELSKILLNSPQPGRGLEMMREMNLIKRHHPVLQAMMGAPMRNDRDSIWHHTIRAINIAAGLKEYTSAPRNYMLAVLLHATGRSISSDPWYYPRESRRIAADFLLNLRTGKRICQEVCNLVEKHMHPLCYYEKPLMVNRKTITKLNNQINLEDLLMLTQAVLTSCGQEVKFQAIRAWLMQQVSYLGLTINQAVPAIITGKDLIAIGLTPGPVFRTLLDCAYELQLEGYSYADIMKNITIIKP